MMTTEVTFRSIEPDDRPFLMRLYGTTRQNELQYTDWNAEQKQAFIEQQFEAQQTYYLSQFADGAFDVIALDHQPIGRRYVHRSRDEIRLIDLTILPEFQSRGIGRGILKQLQEEAKASKRPLRHHVQIDNQQALKLYQFLGFKVIEQKETHLFMEWSPELVKFDG